MKIAMGYDACVYCAHCCRDGAPVYRSGEEDGEFCTRCDSDYCNFEWRGVTEREDRRVVHAGADPG